MKKKENQKRPYETPFMDVVPIMMESAILGVSTTAEDPVTEDDPLNGTDDPFDEDSAEGEG